MARGRFYTYYGRHRSFYCGACASPVYTYETFPLCPLCAYEQHIARLRQAKARRENGRPAGASDGSTLGDNPEGLASAERSRI